MADMGTAADRTMIARKPQGKPNPPAEDGRYTVTVVDRTLTVLEALADTPDVGVTELAARLGLTKSLVFRLLFTL